MTTTTTLSPTLAASVEAVIAAARARGSRAQTLRGALRYFRENGLCLPVPAGLRATTPQDEAEGWRRNDLARITDFFRTGRVMIYRGLRSDPQTLHGSRAWRALVVAARYQIPATYAWGRRMLDLPAETLRRMAQSRRYMVAAQAWCTALGLPTLDEAEAIVTEQVAALLPGFRGAPTPDEIALATALHAAGFADREAVRKAAIAIGEHAHAQAPLVRSQRAEIAYGRGGRKRYDYPYRGAASRYRATWHDAGAYWALDRGRLAVVVEDSAGRQRLRAYMPADVQDIGRRRLSAVGCLPADAYALDAGKTRAGHRRRRRYTADGRPSGWAVLLPVPAELRPYWPTAVNSMTGCYWEHGATLAAVQEEYRRKLAVAEGTRRERTDPRAARRTRLLARLSQRLTATYSDARQAGYCDAGIRSWCTSRGIAPDAAVPLARLAHDPDDRAQRVALLVARRALAQ